MRLFLGLLAAGLVATGCDTPGNGASGGSTGAASGYTLEIRASELEQTYLIVAPDGRTTGARAAEGASALMNSDRARALFDDPPPMQDVDSEVLGLRLPGFEISIGGDEEDPNGDNGQVRLSIGGGGRTIIVNADEGGPGDADDRAYVRITGADEEEIRDFISDAEGLSDEVRGQMLAALGLPETAPKGQ